MTRFFRWALALAIFGSTLVLAQAPAQVTAPSTGSGNVGDLALEGVAQGALVSVSDGVAYHTYWVDVPAGLASWTLTLDADIDLDIALKFGSEITTYVERAEGGDWDYRDIDTRNPTTVVIERPQAGRWYVDVFNALQTGTRGSYRLSLSAVADTAGANVRPSTPPAKGGLAPVTPAAPAVTSATVVAPSTESMVVGGMPYQGIAQGTLVAVAEGDAFHTYWVDIPAGVSSWTISLESAVDLDLALKYGSEIGSYFDQADGGDWDYRDIDTVNPTTFTIENPTAGRWYVDVFTLLAAGTEGAYRLVSSTR
ncbi:MAG: hypothetical protein R6W77_11700 [Trueperaceae bacterium]